MNSVCFLYQNFSFYSGCEHESDFVLSGSWRWTQFVHFFILKEKHSCSVSVLTQNCQASTLGAFRSPESGKCISFNLAAGTHLSTFPSAHPDLPPSYKTPTSRSHSARLLHRQTRPVINGCAGPLHALSTLLRGSETEQQLPPILTPDLSPACQSPVSGLLTGQIYSY